MQSNYIISTFCNFRVMDDKEEHIRVKAAPIIVFGNCEDVKRRCKKAIAEQSRRSTSIHRCSRNSTGCWH